MALDEYLYGKLARYLKVRKLAAEAAQNRTVRLADIKPRLTVLACALTGFPIEIYPAEQEGGYKNNNFFLPETSACFPTAELNHAFYLFRVLYLFVQKQLSLNWHDNNDHDLAQSRSRALESAPNVLERLFSAFPVTEEWHHIFYKTLSESDGASKTPGFSLLYGKWMYDEPGRDTGQPLSYFTDQTGHPANHNTPQTILKARIVEEIQRLEVDKKAQEDYVLTHNFEKVETADEFSGVWRDFDGDDELEDHHDALDELNMKFTVRVDDPAHSVYQADFLENTSISESADAAEKGIFIPYDEWDFARRAYKPGFCRLYPVFPQKTDMAYFRRTLDQYRSLLSGLRRMLTSVNNKMQQQRRQTQGDAFDIDSVTDLYVDIHTGHTPSDKIYLSNRKKDKELSVLLLLDASLSSDGYAAGNRIIDVEKQVAILFGEILQEFKIDFSIHCFYSKTRNYASCLTLKAFDEAWEKARYKIGAVQPGGYTRIGTALRHSGALLDSRPAKNKWLILVSDGKPNDFDKYEGKYGIQDVKQALRELNERQINAFALAIEANAKHYLPQMFGVSNYQIMSSPEGLLTALVQLYERIRYQS